MISSLSLRYLRSWFGDSAAEALLSRELDVLLLQAAQLLEGVGDVVEGLDHLGLELGLDGGERQRILHVVFVVVRLGGGLARILRLLAVLGVAVGLEGRRGGRRRRRRGLRLHHLQVRRAGHRRRGRAHDRLAVGADDHRRLHLLRVGAGVGRLEIDDVAEENLALVELVAPDDDGLEGERALAQPCDHRLAAGLDAFGNGDFALAGQELDRAHLAQVHAHRIVGALGRLLLFGGGERLGADLDQLAALLFVIAVVGGLVLFGFGLVALDDVDAHLRDHGEDVLDLVGGDLLGGQNGVDLLVGDVAALLGGLDHLLDAGVVEIEQRLGIGGGFGLFFRGLVLDLRLCLRRHRYFPSPSTGTDGGAKKHPPIIRGLSRSQSPTWPKGRRPCRRAPRIRSPVLSEPA